MSRDSKGSDEANRSLTWAALGVILAGALAAAAQVLMAPVWLSLSAVALGLCMLVLDWYLRYRPRIRPPAWITLRRSGTALLLSAAALALLVALPSGDSTLPAVPQHVASRLAIADGAYTVGASGSAGGAPGTVVMRIRENGSLDPAFGARGIAFHRAGVDRTSVDSILAEADGRVIVAGTATPLEGGRVAFLGRLRKDGSADRAFYSESRVDRHAAALVQRQGPDRLLLGVTTWLSYRNAVDAEGHPIENSFALLAQDDTGVVDRAYGEDGGAYGSIECGQRLDIPCRPLLALLLRPSGEAVTAAAQISTVNADGRPGPTSAGPVFASRREGWTALARDSRGRLLAGGARAGGSHAEPQLFVARLRTPDALDLTFGKQGIATVDLPADRSEPGGIAPLSDGRILVAGRSTTQTRDGIAVVRLRENGKLDRSFGNGGTVLLHPLRIDKPLMRRATTEIAVTADGRIVVAEIAIPRADATTGGALALARLRPDGQLDRSFGDDGIASWSLDFSSRVVRAGDRFLGRLQAYRAERSSGFKHVGLGVLCQATRARSFTCWRVDEQRRLLIQIELSGAGRPRVVRRRADCCVKSTAGWRSAVALSIGGEAWVKTPAGPLDCTALRTRLVCAGRSGYGFSISSSQVRTW